MPHLDETLRASLDAVPRVWTPTPLRVAAVLCPIVQQHGEDHLLLLVRTADMRQHAGQVGFPGGMRSGDEDPVACALRECNEEIGVPASEITLLGGLPPRESSSAILVHCLVGRVLPVPVCTDPREVDRVLHVPLRELLDASRWEDKAPPPTATGQQLRTSPHFLFGKDLLWGLTARFVRDLVDRLRG
jgi:8-oxo-dGTP pyrophosphatase MutT (NUDIX family)